MPRQILLAIGLLLACATAGCRKGARNEGGPASSVSSAKDAEPPAAIPAPPPGVDPAWSTIAASICAAAYFKPPPEAIRPKGREVDVGCRSHPPFTRPEQKPDGKILLHTGDPLEFCTIDVVYRGSFTRPGAREAVVSFAPCKDGDGAWDMANPGSAVLVEEAPGGGRWRAIDYQADVNIAPDRGALPASAPELRFASGCDEVRRADNRDALVCASNFGAFGLGSMTYIFFVDFARTPHARTVARMLEDADPCGPSGIASPEKDGLVTFQLGTRTLGDTNGDKTPDVSVEITRARAVPSSALAAKVKAECAKNANSDIARLAPPGKKTTLQFLSDADGWGPSPASKATLAAWIAERPDGFGGIEKAGPPDR
jgi:hypothetical protein